MKIGFIATEIGYQEGGAFMGGNVNNVVSLSKRLADRGHKVHIITTIPRDPAENPTKPIDWATVHSHDIDFEHGSPKYGVSFIHHSIRTIKRLKDSGEIDVVSVHAGFTVWAIINRLSKLLANCPSVHVQYCPINEQSGNTLYDFLQSPWLSRYYLSGSDQLVAVSPNTAKSMRSVRPSEDIRIIPPSINTEKYKPTAATRFDLFETTEPIIGYMGSLKPQKGLDVLIEAFERIREERPVKLALALEVRSGRSNTELKRKVDQHKDIYCYGIVKDVPAFLAQSDIFAVPFRTTMGPADYPVSALEAMACETPLVTTDVGGLRELTDSGNAGICVSRPDPTSLFEGIRKLLENESLRKEKGSNAREYILSNCSIEQMANQYERVFEEVVDAESS